MEEIQQYQIDPYDGLMLYYGTDTCGDTEFSTRWVKYEDHLRIVNDLQKRIAELSRNP